MKNSYLFTSESVSEGHPDKVADQISDAIVDALIAQDSRSRIACETMVNTGMAVIAGEITANATIDFSKIARDTIRTIGYTRPESGYMADNIAVLVALDEQSPDIARGVDETEQSEQRAGDQGFVFGFACDETASLMPAAIDFAHRLMRRQAEIRKQDPRFAWLGPDAKSQITLRYEDNRPVAIDTVVLSTQHAPDISLKEIRAAVMEMIIQPVLPARWLGKNTRYHINPTGRFVIGGPVADCGLTGRKIIIDTYGGMARHGGGAFSGKDPSKVDRSAAYAARYVAKNIVAAGLARRCEIQIAYVIGVAEPASINVNTFGTGTVDDVRLSVAVSKCFDLRPKGIIDMLDLLRPIYKPISVYGHFGRDDLDLPWERTDKAAALKAALC